MITNDNRLIEAVMGPGASHLLRTQRVSGDSVRLASVRGTFEFFELQALAAAACVQLCMHMHTHLHGLAVEYFLCQVNLGERTLVMWQWCCGGVIQPFSAKFIFVYRFFSLRLLWCTARALAGTHCMAAGNSGHTHALSPACGAAAHTQRACNSEQDSRLRGCCSHTMCMQL